MDQYVQAAEAASTVAAVCIRQSTRGASISRFARYE